MPSWPILTLVTFLPLIGALFVLVVRGEDETALRNMRWTALFTTAITFLLSLNLWIDFDPAQAGFQFVEEHAWLGNFASYRLGVDGISMPFVHPYHLPHADLHPGELDDPLAREGVHDRLPGPRDHDGRRVHRDGPLPVLPLLRGRPHPDVPDHRHLGRAAAGLCELQILPLHAARLAAHAARDVRHVLAFGHDPTSPCCSRRRTSRPPCRLGCGSRSSPHSP